MPRKKRAKAEESARSGNLASTKAASPDKEPKTPSLSNQQIQAVSNLRDQAEKVMDETKRKLDEGYQKPNASTGTPIASLNGGAKDNARKANGGGGAKSSGGGGIEEHDRRVATYERAKAVVDTLNTLEKNGILPPPPTQNALPEEGA